MENVIFRPAAAVELREAYEWYEQRDVGLGMEFMRCVESCLETTKRHPAIYPVVYQNVRQGLVRRFPYSVFYLVAKEEIVVLSIFHAKRNPRIWQRRA